MKSTIPVYDICKLSDFQEEDILISRFGAYLQKHKNLHFPHKHTFYHLVLFTKGGGSHSIDFRSFEVVPYQVYFMTPGQVHSWSFEGDVDGYVIHFSAAFFQSFLLKNDYINQFPFFSGLVDDSVINIPVDQQPKAREIFEEIINEAENPGRMDADLIRVLMLQVFILIARINIEDDKKIQLPTYNYILLKTFRKLIEKNFAAMKMPKDYAALLYITPNHLNAVCNDLLGVSAGEVIRDRVLLEAKRLLINLDLTIAEIAYKLNFNDNSYFTKFFKKYTGLTPEEFRKENKNNKTMTSDISTPEKPSEFKSALHAKCPKCRKGNMFANSMYGFGSQKMHTKCPYCNFQFEIEPGYFYVAMFVSYGMNVIEMVISGITTFMLTHSESPWVYIGVLFAVTIILSPFNYRYSRIMLLYWLTPNLHYDPEKAKKPYDTN